MQSLGIIAGNRDFPIWVARGARNQGVGHLVAVGFPGITSPALKECVDEISWVGLGQLGRLKKVFQTRQVQNMVMAGQIPPKLALRALKFDLEGLRFFKRMKEKNAKAILGALIEHLEGEGFRFLDSTLFLKNHLVGAGVLTRKKPSAQELEDLRLGALAARRLADLEAGQTVVVKRGVVVAMEGLEGTDGAILRGGELAGRGAVVVKMARSNQDLRYDVPVVGLETLRSLRRAGARCLGLEAHRTLVMEPDSFFKEADRTGIAVVGVEDGK